MVQYVWVSKLTKQEVSDRYDTPEEAGEWLRGSEGQRKVTATMFGFELRAINEGNWSRGATGAEKLTAGVY